MKYASLCWKIKIDEEIKRKFIINIGFLWVISGIDTKSLIIVDKNLNSQTWMNQSLLNIQIQQIIILFYIKIFSMNLTESELYDKTTKHYQFTSDSAPPISPTYNLEVSRKINDFSDLIFDSPLKRRSLSLSFCETNISPFSPFLQSESSAQESMTDRYIPSRKLSKKEHLFNSQDLQQNNQNNKTKPESSACVADVYKKYLISGNYLTKETQFNQSIGVFQNANIFKYSSKNILQPKDVLGLTKKTSLQFTDVLASCNNRKRKICKVPFKVLDAPALQDDYYLNLIDWSSQNLLAVGLASSVYLWNANNSKVTKLCQLGITQSVTSVSWSVKGPHISLGTNKGEVQIWDVNKIKRVRIMNGHSNRVGSMAWNSTIFSTGSRDKTILNRDLRISAPFISRFVGHKQEVCGLKWSYDEQQLCSGGNDNKLLIWNPHSLGPVIKFKDHIAAVKAMAWSPHQHGLLISGGGTADRTIKFRNTLTGETTKSIDVGSQVCNLMFAKNLNEIVSTHGYSQNEINIWKYPKMEKISTLSGHTFRVLYLAMSPDGSTIVTGAGDQTLRFWNVFPHKNEQKIDRSRLNMEEITIR